MSEATIDRELLERIRELLYIIAHRQDDYGVEAGLVGSLLTKAIAQPTQQGEAVEVVGMRIRTDGFGSYIADFAMGVPAAMPGEAREPLMTVAQHQRILAAATRPADQVAEGVVVSRELLENCADYMMGSASARVRIWHDQCRALLASAEGVKDE